MSDQERLSALGASGGRRGAAGQRDEALRQFTINYRRARVAHLVHRDGLGRGQQARIARALGASTSTISRDVAALLALVAPCPYCGSYPLLAGPLQDPAAAEAQRVGAPVASAPLGRTEQGGFRDP